MSSLMGKCKKCKRLFQCKNPVQFINRFIAFHIGINGVFLICESDLSMTATLLTPAKVNGFPVTG